MRHATGARLGIGPRVAAKPFDKVLIVTGANNMDPLAPGNEIGKYRVVRRLATGGMAEIYLAQARGIQGFEKYVVLKRILPQYAASETFVRLFLNEARVAATLDHPNVASVYDIGEIDGMYFFTMEYLHGEDLGHILRETVGRSIRIPLEHALTIGAAVAAGLHAAHEKKGPDGRPLGIVHRDVSPSNVVVTYDGGVKLVDFGVAKITANAELTKTGSVKGKLAYMSPEQCGNEGIDRRSDIFALGVLLYELTTQTRLFKADSEAATLRMVLEARVPPPSTRVPNFPEDLEPILFKALARERDERFSTAREMQMALEQVARQHGVVTSTAELGDWMVRCFGRRVEPWLETPLPPANWTRDEMPVLSPPAVAAAMQMGPTLPTLVTGPVLPEPARRRRSPALLVGASALVLGLGAAGVWAARSQGQPHEQPPVFVVPEKGEVSVETAIVPIPRAAEAAAQTPPSVTAVVPQPAPQETAVAPKPARSRARSARPERGRADDRTRQFTEAFARKERELSRCFDAFPGEAASAPQLFVRFQAGADGRVTSAEVLPAEIAVTPLGGCLAKVAAQTEFGPQPEPVAFRIPVSVRRLSGGRKP